MSENTFWATFWAMVSAVALAVVAGITYTTIRGQQVTMDRLKVEERLQSACISAGGSVVSHGNTSHCIQQSAKSAVSNR